MRKHRIVVLLFWGWLAFVPVALGQVFEGEDSQTLRASSPPQAAGEKPDLDRAARLIVEQTNRFRQEQGLSALEANAELTAAARYFAGHMAKTNKHSHTADGKRPADRAAQFGYKHCLVTENIAYQYSSTGFAAEALAERFVKTWKKSPGHRKNLLDAGATEIGVAVAHSPETGYYYAVQMFGRPQSQRIEFSIANHSQADIQYQIGEQTFPLPPRYTRTHQLCRPAELKFLLGEGEGDEGKTKTVKPARSDQFVVEGAPGALEVKKLESGL